MVWMPPGASRFCSRQAWGKQVAYSTQFEAPLERALTAREKVNRDLLAISIRVIGRPPKPKWMRWPTYGRLAIGDHHVAVRHRVRHEGSWAKPYHKEKAPTEADAR